jgi:signal transduction histidine kinase
MAEHSSDVWDRAHRDARLSLAELWLRASDPGQLSASERQRTTSGLRAIKEITNSFLPGMSVQSTLSTVAGRAITLMDATACWIVTPGPGLHIVVATTAGVLAKMLVGLELSETSSGSGLVMQSGKLDALVDLSSAPNMPPQIARLGLGPAIHAPLVADDRHIGTLVVARAKDDRPFDDIDLALIETLAGATATAVELCRARDDVEDLRVLDDGERIARDLFDNLVRQLFAMGLSLQTASRMADDAVSERIDDAVDVLDEVIREVRRTVFAVMGGSSSALGVQQTVQGMIEEMAVSLGVTRRLRLLGSSDTELSDPAPAS